MNKMKLLSDFSKFLKQYEEKFWSGKVDALIADHNNNSIAEIESWYGGMGSLNDLILSSVNGHKVNPTEEDSVNEKLDTFREQIYDIFVEGVS